MKAEYFHSCSEWWAAVQSKKRIRRCSCITFTVQMKNWLPFVSGPALAMLSTPGPTCFTADKSKSCQCYCSFSFISLQILSKG